MGFWALGRRLVVRDALPARLRSCIRSSALLCFALLCLVLRDMILGSRKCRYSKYCSAVHGS
jgi:hypothetical protein